MEREYVVGDINMELEEIERMSEKMQESIEPRFTIGAFYTLLCCN